MSDKMQRFTQGAKRVLSLAQEAAERLQHSYIGTEHLLIGLMREEGGVAGRVLKQLGLDAAEVEALVERKTRSGQRTPFAKLDLSPGTKKVLELAVEEARRRGHHDIGTAYLLLALVRYNEGIAIDALKTFKISPEQIRKQINWVLEDTPSALRPGKYRPRSVYSSKAKEESVDSQIVELMGRNHLVNELLAAGLEVATPLRDRGIDLIVYADLGEGVSQFSARPVQMKAASKQSFSIDRKYEKFPDLIIAFVWGLEDPAHTATFAMTYGQAVAIADQMGYTQTTSWLEKNKYSATDVTEKLANLIEPHRTTLDGWRQLVIGS